MIKPEIPFDTFAKADLRVGTVVEAFPNPKARKPAFVLKIDFGPLGIKTSSAQLCANYSESSLIGKQIIAVVNFGTKNIAGIPSEVLVLGAENESTGTLLLHPGPGAANGDPIH